MWLSCAGFLHALHHCTAGVKRLYKDDHGHGHGEVDASVKGANLHYMALLDRIAGEFMVLGFLSFCVWSCNQNHGFATIGGWLGTSLSEYETLHQFENVHVYLFIGMVLNFVVSGWLIYRIVRWQIQLAKFENPSLVNNAIEPEASAFRAWPPAMLSDGGTAETTSQAKYDALRKYFMEITGKDDDGVVILDKVNFARYLSCCLDDVLADVINFSEYTWLLVLFIELIQSVCTGFISYPMYGTVSGIQV